MFDDERRSKSPEDTPSRRYNPNELVKALFNPQTEQQSPFEIFSQGYSPKEVRNVIKGIMFMGASQAILSEITDAQETVDQANINFLPVSVNISTNGKEVTFRTPEDLKTDGKADFGKIKYYIIGLFKHYADRTYDTLAQAHPHIPLIYDEATRRLAESGANVTEGRFSALDLGIDAICAFVNSAEIEAKLPGMPTSLEILGNSMPLLVSIARESIEAKGNPSMLGVFGLKKDPSPTERAASNFKATFMDLPTAQAIKFLSESIRVIQKDRSNNNQFQAQYTSQTLELIRRLGEITHNNHGISLAELALDEPAVTDILETYISNSGDGYDELATTIYMLARNGASELHDAARKLETSWGKHFSQNILNPAFFQYSDPPQGFTHVLDRTGRSSYFGAETRAGEVLREITPTEIVTGCAGLMFNMKPESQDEQNYWANFPKIPRNAIGLALTIAYIYGSS